MDFITDLPLSSGFDSVLVVHIQERLIIELSAAQERYKKYADRHQQEAPIYNIEDKVWLVRWNIKTERPSEKLDHQKLGLFEIAAQISPAAYCLTLPPSFKIHNTFHVLLLELYMANTILGRVAKPLPPIIIDEACEYEVKEILDTKLSWENVEHTGEAVEVFYRQHPDKPKPVSKCDRNFCNNDKGRKLLRGKWCNNQALT
ncbi:7767_t:CDS:2 [Dentiscutata erythropus]|uniref:7767_t:CDS:1 n=1 Tax=Dentiscutata erythropus TaxID=1348616 RepID=A0A9N9NTZ2_9GLOM|nr:7767_t:CDS:2 [Dentiscutata erythropus]